MSETPFIGGETPVADKPVKDPALKWRSIFPNLHSQIISGNMPKEISIEILVHKRFLGVSANTIISFLES